MSDNKPWRAIDTSDFIKSPFLRGGYSWVQPLVEKYLGFNKLTEIHGDIVTIMERDQTEGADGFSQGCIERLQAEVIFEEGVLESLLQISGPVVVVANHPYGCIDAMALMRCMQEVRPEDGGWKIMANRILRSIADLRGVTFAVDPFAKKSERAANVSVMKEAITYLKSGGMLGMFPAGRVSAVSDDLGVVCDLPWSAHALKLAKSAGAHIVVLHISGQNSDEFLAVPTDNVSRRAVKLAGEIPKMLGEKVRLSLGGVLEPGEVAKMLKKKDGVSQLHARCHAAQEKGGTSKEGQEIDLGENSSVGSSALGREKLNSEITTLREEATLWKNSHLSLFLFRGEDSPYLLEQVGVGRAVTFAAIGAGSGNDVDLTPEDQYYHHLVLWDDDQSSLVGSYRIGFTKEVIAERGVDGLYLNKVFDIDTKFHDHLGPAMELSRSFILPSYQKNPQMLDLLWRGLGLAAAKMGCESLFGSVTIPASYSTLSQAILVETLDKYYSSEPELRALVKARVAYQAETKYHPLVASAWKEDGLNKLNAYIEELENGERAIPPLMRYYVSLGARFSSFHVEESFNNAVYCLLNVRVQDMPNRYRKRFFW